LFLEDRVMGSNETRTSDPDDQPHLACWFCSEPLRLTDVLRVGILRSRTEREGGPYQLFVCLGCQRQNQCERTPRGRWFSSPTSHPNLLDYVLGRVFLAGPEDFLKAITWHRENEERRRYFFERDGDARYSGRGLFGRRRTRAEASPATSQSAESRAASGGARPGTREARRHGVMSPWELLGVPPQASEDAIRRAFQRLAVQVHPDKVHHLGEEFQRLAHIRFTELQKAYEELLRRARKEDGGTGEEV
jgi:hypothetical protein